MIGLDFEVRRNGIVVADLPVVFGPDLENNDSRDRAMMMNLKIGAYANEKLESIDFAKLKTLPQAGKAFEKASGEKGSGFYWAAYETTYFAAVFKSAPQNRSKLSYQVIKQPRGKDPAKLYSYMILTDPVAVFLGPKDEKHLAAVEKEFPDLNKIIEYGWFGAIAKVMLKGITFIHGFLPNYGWAIILFTLFLKLILFPLTYSSSVSMAKMQNLQPKMKAIKKKYKNTKDMEQRKLMNMEMMALYKQEKVNPAGGCLPLLLQLPLLWGFFRLLSVSINVRHEPWMLWITDLSKKDPYYVLPILMGVTQLIQTRMQPVGRRRYAEKDDVHPAVRHGHHVRLLPQRPEPVLVLLQRTADRAAVHRQREDPQGEEGRGARDQGAEKEKRSQREMTDTKEFVANSLKDAILKAAEDFGVPEEKLKYRIITEKTKYFGHKQREIFIEAWRSDGSEQQGLEGFVRLLLEEMKLDLKFDIEAKSDFLRVNFSGEDYKLMLYQNGNLLNAVQYLVNRLFADAIGKKIFCECENYRKKKEVELSAQAHRFARQVRRSGKAVDLPEMNPFERRIIHMTINKYSDLESKSDGDNFLKVITIRKKTNG